MNKEVSDIAKGQCTAVWKEQKNWNSSNKTSKNNKTAFDLKLDKFTNRNLLQRGTFSWLSKFETIIAINSYKFSHSRKINSLLHCGYEDISIAMLAITTFHHP